MKNSILYFLVFIFFGCSSAKIEIEQEGMLPLEMRFYSSVRVNLEFKNKIQIKNNSLNFVSLKIGYTNAPEGDVLSFLASEYNKKEDRYVRFEDETIHLYPLQKKKIFYKLRFTGDVRNQEDKELKPYIDKYYDVYEIEKKWKKKQEMIWELEDKMVKDKKYDRSKIVELERKYSEIPEIQIDYSEFKKKHPKLLEHLTKGFDTIEVRVLKPKEEVFYFPAKW